jgi:hypothetical protein
LLTFTRQRIVDKQGFGMNVGEMNHVPYLDNQARFENRGKRPTESVIYGEVEI